ncbi:redox-sensing transcriptional repressor Rex, partial [Anaerolineales bacterium HSG6]|nr:redox-sensing transcriptional repressor Rex [Anaerolineales bacterium HSG6]
MSRSRVPDIVVGRLPIYLRTLHQLEDTGYTFTSSQELGKRIGISSAQIRKDLAHFGEFGKQGTGYEVKYLQEQIAKILNVDQDWSVALVGFGDLGQALSRYSGFARKGFHIDVVFDQDPQKIGKKYHEVTIYDFEELAKIVSSQGIKLAIIAVPGFAAQDVAEKLVEAGVRAILNYAPVKLFVDEGVRVEYIDPIAHLQ